MGRPCITSSIDLRGTADVNDGMLIEEGSLPGPIAGLLPAPLAAASKLLGVDTDQGIRDKIGEKAREFGKNAAGDVSPYILEHLEANR